MCQQFVGDEAFRLGLKNYFTEFAYQNTEADDLWKHLSAASGKDISALMHTWISQSGYPVVHVNSDGLRQEQFFIGQHKPSQKLWPIPLDAESSEDLPALLETSELSLPIADDERLNIHDASHFITHYSPEHLAKLLAKLADTSEIGRLQLLHEQTLLVRGGVVSSDTLINLLEAYSGEQTNSVWGIMSLALGELKKFVESNEEAEQKLKELAIRLAKPQFEKLGWQIVDGEDESDTKLRSLIIGMMMYGEDESVRAHAQELFESGIENIDPEVRSLVIGSVVKSSRDIELTSDLLQKYRSTQSADLREDICSGLTSARQSAQIELLLASFTDSSIIRQQDLFRWFAYLIRNRYAREMTWAWMKDKWDWIEQIFGGDKSYDDFPRYAAAGLTTREQLDDFANFFTSKRDIPALTRTIDLGIKEIEAKVETIENDGALVIDRLMDL
jgi:aminopeptidase N